MASERDRHEKPQTAHDDVAEANKLGVEIGEVVVNRITEEDILRQSQESLTIYSRTGVRICLMMFVMGCNQAAYGVDWGVIGGINSFPRWHDYYGFGNAGVIISTINALMQIGTFVGSPFLALSDVIGRRGVNFAGNFLTLIAAFMQGNAPNIGVLMAGRIVLGFGTALCTSSQYVAEVAPAHMRGRIVGIFGACFQVGSMMMLGIMMALSKWDTDWQWRVAFMLQAIFPLIVCVFIFILCPESPRYLVMKGKINEAKRVIARYQTTSNDINDPLVPMIIRQIEDSLENASVMQTLRSSYDFRVFFTRAVGFRTFVLLIYSIFQQWNGGGIISYYLSPALDTVGITEPLPQLGINLGSTGLYFVFTLVGAWLVEFYNRRTLIFVGIFLMVIFQTAVTITSWRFDLKASETTAALMVTWVYCFQICSATFIATMHNLYPVELLSLSLRAKGMGLYSMFQGAAGVVHTYGIGVGIEKLGYKIWAVYIAYNALQGILAYFVFPETAKLSLEEIDLIFETPGERPVPLSIKIAKAREEKRKLNRAEAEARASGVVSEAGV